MFLDSSLWIYVLLFAGVFALELGVFDLFGGKDADDDAEAAADPAPVVEEGPDYVASAYSNEVAGTDGSDILVADPGELDVAYFAGDGDDTVIATDGADFADGGAGADLLTGLDGDDKLAGGPGDDQLRGGTGDDELYGQAGDDVIEGHGGDDLIYGGSGDDRIAAGYGDDLIYGGDGNDTISTDTLDNPVGMGRGLDVVFGGDGDDNIFLGDGDEATGGAGADTFTVFEIASPDAPPANITDFEAESDSLHVLYQGRSDPDTGDPIAPSLTVGYDAETDITSIALDGAPIATLAGNPGITEADVTLTAFT